MSQATPCEYLSAMIYNEWNTRSCERVFYLTFSFHVAVRHFLLVKFSPIFNVYPNCSQSLNFTLPFLRIMHQVYYILKLLLCLLSFLSRAALSLPQEGLQLNSTLSSSYLISDCGDRTPQVSTVIDLARAAAAAAIAPSRIGTSSGNIYTAFFKRNSASKYVTSMLENIKNHTPIRGRWPNRLKASGPEFICVKSDTFARYKPLRVDPYWFCMQPRMYGFWARQSRYIFLCDFFFERPVTPPSIDSHSSQPADTCLRVDRRFNAFVGFGNVVCLYQKYMLIHEMMHFYLESKTLRLQSTPREEYDLTKCVKFFETLSLRNSQNYQAFVTMVEQRCIETPNPFINILRKSETSNGILNATVLEEWDPNEEIALG